MVAAIRYITNGTYLNIMKELLTDETAESLKPLKDRIAKCIDLYAEAVEKVTRLLSAVAVAVVCLMLGAMVLFFALYALAWWAGALLGSVATGFIIVAVLLMVMAIVFYCHRQQWVVQPLARLMAGLFLDNDYEEEEESDE